MRAEDVSAAGGAVVIGDDTVHVDDRLAVEERDVAAEGDDFDLLVDGNDAKHFFVEVEPGEARVMESADGGEVSGLDVVVGGDTCERRKPDPQPLLFSCESLHVPATESLMVGDSVNDVQAARAAGIPVICVSYGYNEGRDPRTLDCDALLDSLSELPPLLLD